MTDFLILILMFLAGAGLFGWSCWYAWKWHGVNPVPNEMLLVLAAVGLPLGFGVVLSSGAVMELLLTHG